MTTKQFVNCGFWASLPMLKDENKIVLYGSTPARGFFSIEMEIEKYIDFMFDCNREDLLIEYNNEMKFILSNKKLRDIQERIKLKRIKGDFE